ncbi:MAG: phosphate ABC transporter permease subunit PstC, partial [Rhodopirellula sp. JB055]
MNRPTALVNKKFRSTGIGVVQEKAMVALLAFCALLTVGITLGIIVMLIGESWHFIQSEYVSLSGFLTGTEWTALQSKDIEKAKFGIWPLLSGTLRV